VNTLKEGQDYYFNDQGLWVFTEQYHIEKGYCCGNGCLHCPYGYSLGQKTIPDQDHMLSSVDQMGQTIHLPFPPKRIVSLVPSQTELLFDLGLENEIIGITKFCIHPEDKVKGIEKIGGTKKFNIEKIHALQPDLIIGNKEENYIEGIEQLQQHYPVWMSDILTVKDALTMIREVSRITDRAEKGKHLAEEIVRKFVAYEPLKQKQRAAYLIWRDPFMVVGRDTFIDEMLTRFGVINIFQDQVRYPEVTLESIVNRKPELIFLSSEPYPFKEKHVEEFRAALPGAKVIIVDGESFSWYGSRLGKSIDYFNDLKTSIDRS